MPLSSGLVLLGFLGGEGPHLRPPLVFLNVCMLKEARLDLFFFERCEPQHWDCTLKTSLKSAFHREDLFPNTVPPEAEDQHVKLRRYKHVLCYAGRDC